MRFRFLIAVAVVLFVALAVRPKTDAITYSTTYYVQLVRAGDADEPPEPDSKRVGHRLITMLKGPFKWKNYWEVNRQEVALSPGGVANVRLCKRCQVNIDLTDKRNRKVTAFENGNMVERVTTPMGESMTLVGGDWDGRSAWFIVVRRDKPSANLN